VDIRWFFAGVAVADYPSARAWYQRLMGRPPDFIPHEHEAVWQVIENAWIYVVADSERAGKALLTLMVDDRLKPSRVATEKPKSPTQRETRSPSVRRSAQTTTNTEVP